MKKLINFLVILATACAHYYKTHTTTDDAKKEDLYGTPIANCGGDFTNINAVLYPSEFLEMGQEAYIYMEYNAPIQIEAGYVLTSITFNGVPYPQFNSSLCSNTESTITKFLRSPFNYLKSRYYEKLTSVECPITTGQHSKNSSFTVPNDSGILKSKIAWFSDTGRLLLCLKIAAEILQPNVIHNHI